jgi:hypothetical protein
MHRQGAVLRKFALLASICTFLSATLAHAQQFDIALGGSTLLSSSRPSDLVTFHPPVEKGGTFVSVSGDFVGFRKRRVGLNIETAWRYRQANYPDNGETYRPIFTDVNALFQPRMGKIHGRQVGLDLMGGIGVASTRFDLPNAYSCNSNTGCINFASSNHFMEHLGAGVRYRVWRKFFIRPEIHYYHVQNYVEFNSGSVFRVGASLGYTFGSQ